MDEYGINIKGDVTVDEDNSFDIGSPTKRVKKLYVHDVDSTGEVWFTDASAPAETSPGLPWFNTANDILQIRNAADSAWLGVMYGDSTTKIWIYSNTASEGWAIDSSVTDVVLALKGGSQAYNANGGTEGGTWTQPDHTLIESEMPSHTHTQFIGAAGGAYRSGANGSPWTPDGTTTPTGSTGGDAAHNHGTTYRPDAAIGTLQYPDSA